MTQLLPRNTITATRVGRASDWNVRLTLSMSSAFQRSDKSKLIWVTPPPSALVACHLLYFTSSVFNFFLLLLYSFVSFLTFISIIISIFGLKLVFYGYATVPVYGKRDSDYAFSPIPTRVFGC
jgi:hypothetical protein